MTLIDTATAAVAAGVKPATIRQWAQRGRLVAQGRRGRQNLYAIDELRHLMRRETEA